MSGLTTVSVCSRRGISDPSQVAGVEAHFSAYYDIPDKNIANAITERTYTFKLK